MQKKNKKLIITATLIFAAILLIAAAVLFFFRYLPLRQLEVLQKTYLLQNRDTLRIQSIQAGAYNKFILHDIQLGDAQKPLISAPTAEMQVGSDFSGALKKLQISVVTLKDCRINVQSRKGKVYINNIFLQDFAAGLQKLPSAPDGTPITWEIHSKLSFGSKEPSSYLILKIRQEDNKLNITAVWRALNDQDIYGSWQAFIDPAKDQLAVTLKDCVNEIFMQEMMLRSGASNKAVSVLKKAFVWGEGSFSGSFKQMKIDELAYSGKATAATLDFYKYQLKNIDPFVIELKKNASGFTCRVPEFSWNNKQAGHLKNIEIKYRKDITFSAECNFQQLVMDLGSKQLALAVKSNAPGGDRLKGVWNLKNNQWSFAKVKNKQQSSSLLFETPDFSFAMESEEYDFQAGGKGASGTITQEIKFKKLEVYPAGSQKNLQSAGGSLTIQSSFGVPHLPDQHALSMTFKDFSASTDWGFVEIPLLSASAELQMKEDGMLDVYASASGGYLKTVYQNKLYTADNWRGLFRLLLDRKNGNCQIKSMDFKSDKLNLEIGKKKYTIPGAHIHLSGLYAGKQLTEANIKVQGSKITAADLSINKANLQLNIFRDPANGRQYKGVASCKSGEFAISDHWSISRLSDASVSFSGSGDLISPDQAALQAAMLDWQKNDFSGTFQNSKWQIERKKDKSLGCAVEFDYLKLQSKDQKFGSGQLGKSSFSADLLLDSNGNFSKLDMVGIFGHLSWLKGDYHLGCESVQGEIKYNNQHSTLMQCSLNMTQAVILSSQITASTPELKCSVTASDMENITGKIDFAPGSITDLSGNLELKKTRFSLPIEISKKQRASRSAGKFIAEEIFFKHQREGSFSGTISHFMHLPDSVTDTMTHQIELEGKLKSNKFSKQPVTLNSTWLLPPEKSVVKWQFSMPENKLIQPVILSNYLPFPLDCALLKGNFTLSGSLESAPDRSASGLIKLNSINSAWQLGAVAADGVTGEGVLSFDGRKYSFMPQDISVSQIQWNNIKLNDNELNISVGSDGKLYVANWKGLWLGGKFRSVQLPPVNLNKHDNNIQPMKFTLSDMPLEKFFNRFGVKCFISEATLNGDIQLNIQNNKLHVDNSALTFKSQAGQLLQLKLKNPSAIKMRDIQFRDFTAAVLNAMKCYQANFKFSTTPDEIFLQLKADGVPAAPVPFVYQGKEGKTPFRPAGAGENGFSGEIELNINLKLHPDSPGA